MATQEDLDRACIARPTLRAEFDVLEHPILKQHVKIETSVPDASSIFIAALLNQNRDLEILHVSQDRSPGVITRAYEVYATYVQRIGDTATLTLGGSFMTRCTSSSSVSVQSVGLKDSTAFKNQDIIITDDIDEGHFPDCISFHLKEL